MAVIRRATADDLPFLEEIFVIAADWNPDNHKGAEYWRADPSFAKYIGGFPRESDLGLIAERDGRQVGAVWWRYFAADEPGYGFVDEKTPELGIGVVSGLRGEGVGRALLKAIIALAPGNLSLSVEDGNAAIELYRREGFEAVGRFGSSTTMLRRATRSG